MIVVIDNHDSFTYNIVQYLHELGAEVRVHRCDAIDVEAVRASRPRGILLSPGPGDPTQAGVTLEVIRTLGPTVPVLGVCLGHQAIGQVHGAALIRAARPMHGRTSRVHHDGAGVFRGLPSPLTAARYHSLILDRESLAGGLVCSAWTDQGEVMGIRHRTLPIEGVQFHPESFLSEHGHRLLQNWLDTLMTTSASRQEVAA